MQQYKLKNYIYQELCHPADTKRNGALESGIKCLNYKEIQLMFI